MTTQLRQIGFTLGALHSVVIHTNAHATACQVQLDASRPARIEWTGFKTTEKKPVSGSFTRFTVTSNLKQPAKNFERLAKSLSVSADLTSVSSGNQDRDSNLQQGFFAKISDATTVQAKIVKLQSERGEMLLSLNGIKKNVPFEIKTKPTDQHLEIEATTTLDVADFGLSGAIASLNRLCSELHKGPDGVSKTWQTVELHVHVPILSTCPQPSF